jgi:pyruvate/2-oxoglutarate dehydrogenase complex dihydrolipoamide dehydrogenase (E3) component
MAGKVNPAPEDNVGHPSSTIALRPTKRHIGNKARWLCSPASEADEKGVEFRVEVNDMRDWLSGRTYAETAAWAKVLVDKPTDRIIGAHILGHASEELIHVFALAMKHGITAGDIKELVYGFPTFSADIKSMF